MHRHARYPPCSTLVQPSHRSNTLTDYSIRAKLAYGKRNTLLPKWTIDLRKSLSLLEKTLSAESTKNTVSAFGMSWLVTVSCLSMILCIPVLTISLLCLLVYFQRSLTWRIKQFQPIVSEPWCWMVYHQLALSIFQLIRPFPPPDAGNLRSRDPTCRFWTWFKNWERIWRSYLYHTSSLSKGVWRSALIRDDFPTENSPATTILK